ncbi:beta-mannosidase Bma2A [Talaromyces pinophilus]|uniref:Beta-mannosidase A n=1 Tax=Talaromyces pinophilus TaxID=128442 RepID=A0A478EBI7_TALPI|nr:beta-mannosidase Bma2A [Talaromyces pinophilus]
MLLRGVFLAAGFSLLTSAQHVIDLSGDNWTVQNAQGNVSAPASLPSQVHLDLYAAGVIPDPYAGTNEIDLRWIAWSNWTYTSHPVKGLLNDASSSWLVFNGLDTFATVELCGQIVGTANNQFRQWQFDVSDALKSCKHDPVISINFGSAPVIANAIANETGQETWPAGVQGLFEFDNRWFIRKEQSDFGWDWGPAFSPTGPWQPAYLVQFKHNDGVYVLNTDIDIHREGQVNWLPPDQSNPWVVNASIDYLGALPKGASLTVEIKDSQNKTTIASGSLTNVTTAGSSISGITTVGANVPKLWWPTRMGDQNLYYITINVVDSSNKTLATITKRTGFRTIFLNQTNITDAQIALGIAPGANWHFEINGHEFYAKGSNFIPPDAFWPRVTGDRMRRLFDSIVKGNQNMLRVWASGAYLPDFIYDIADEAGVLLWSEFEFSDALYPVDQAFLDSVAAEVTYNVRRVNHHPSLALWAGGNELESLELLLVYEKAPEEYPRYVGEYEKLFISLIFPLVYDNSHSISYTPTSTGNGYTKVDFSLPVPMVERYENVTPGEYYGDSDYYNYISTEAFDISHYPVDRFANEFGFHSMPSLQTWQQAVTDEDLQFNSSVILHRNHHYPPGGLSTNTTLSAKGMAEMTIAVEQYYPVPSKSDPIANFSAWCLATQRFQADMYKSEIQFYRRGSGRPERQLGSLYWQLEDIWQAPTWAGIEYDGRWKVLHYVAKNIYEPVIVAPYWNSTTGQLNVTVTSDLWESVSGTVNMTWYDLSGKPLEKNAGIPSSVAFEVGPLNITDILTTNIESIADIKDAVLVLSLSATGRLPNSNTITQFSHENFFTPVFTNEAKLVDPGLKLSYNNSTGKFTVEATKGVSLYTWLDYPSGLVGHFDENSFVLVPGQPKEVGFTAQEGSWSDAVVKNVTVQSIWDQAERN